MYFTYILRCADNSYYVGHTDDLEARLATHNAGCGASWTASRLPVTLVHHESFDTPIAAIRRERQLKRWSRAKKEALIAGEMKVLRDLSRSTATKRRMACDTQGGFGDSA